MTDYTPSVEQARLAYAACRRYLDQQGRCTADFLPEFDRMLAAHDRKLREQIAGEIEASDADWHPVAYREGKYSAAMIARGDQHD
jgi:hypothetical protein